MEGEAGGAIRDEIEVRGGGHGVGGERRRGGQQGHGYGKHGEQGSVLFCLTGWRAQETRALDCPLLQGWDGDESLLFTPSEIRTRLLQFLFCRVHRKFREKIDLLPIAVPSTPTSDPRLRQLAGFGELLGLCAGDDVESVSGTADVSRQQEFYRRLLQLIHSKERTESATGEDSALQSHVLASRWFTAELSTGQLLGVLATGRPMTLGLPPLLEHRGGSGGTTLGTLQQQQQEEEEEQLQDLQQRRDALQQEREEETRALTQLQRQLQQQLQARQAAPSHTVPPVAQEGATQEGATQEATLQALTLALRECQRLAAEFCSLSEGELRLPAPPVCSRSPPAVPSRLGPLLHELHAHLGSLAQAADAQARILSECREIHAMHDTRRAQRTEHSVEFEKIKRDSNSWVTTLAEGAGL
ncbi:uncharacterized protein LOC116951171 [Petromyzon marinus]|uniref:uncharacterized protein LOC116951171 n=1 Tax=Petromyzon marinus TaxID=7757 RepID=UPI003F726F5D